MTRNLFSAYIRLVQLPNEVKERNKIKLDAAVPRFDLVDMAGYYKPLESLKNKKGQVIFYLSNTRGVIDSSDKRRADRFLMGKNSLNFSSVYLLSNTAQDGRFVGFGTPNGRKTFGKDKKQNPFYECRNDGFLFVVSPDWNVIEVLIVPDGCNTIQGNAHALVDGIYNEALETMRATAKTFCQY